MKMSVELTRDWDSLSVWGRIVGSPESLQALRLDTGADESLFHNEGAHTMVPSLHPNARWHRGWWVEISGRDAGGGEEITLTRGPVPHVLASYAAHAYAAGINPLPELRRAVEGVRWEYISQAGHDDDGKLCEPDYPTVVVGWERDTGTLTLEYWCGRSWHSCTVVV